MSDENGSKRTRASGEVLDYLLDVFEQNHNPTPEQRREYSEKTNMSEKAVRIWFQNRRAKLRKFERMGKKPDMGKSRLLSPLSAGLSRELQPRPAVDISEKYCFVDCSSLSVASWQRIRTGTHNFSGLKSVLINLSPLAVNDATATADLLVILSKRNAEINYFFSAMSNDTKILFRIFYPISSIVTCSLLDNNINKGSNELRVSLSAPPKFLVFFMNNPNADSNQWLICEDFSEEQLVSTAYCGDGGPAIPHVLVGVRSTMQFLHSYILEHNQLAHSTPRFEPKVHLTDLHETKHSEASYRISTDSLDVWQDRSSMDSKTSPASATSGRSHDMADELPLVPHSNDYENYDMEYRHDEVFEEGSSIHPPDKEGLPDFHHESTFTVDHEYNPETPPDGTAVDSFIDFNAK